MKDYDVIIIGAGAAGMMCGWQAAKRGRRVCLIDHMRKIGEKIRISGGGRCNFTNLYCTAENFISQNPHFCKSALSRFSPYDFMALLDERGIKYHEKQYKGEGPHDKAPLNSQGQMFCDESACDIIDMLKKGCEEHGAVFQRGTKVSGYEKTDKGFVLQTDQGDFTCQSLVIASGGLSIPKIGASNFGYELAKKFGLNIVPPKAALVPLTFDEELLEKTKPLSGASIDAAVKAESGQAFREGLLFTHRGLSGPSILQISSYWREEEAIEINLLPDLDVLQALKERKNKTPKQHLKTVLSELLPSRIAGLMLAFIEFSDQRMADLSDKKLQYAAELIERWQIVPKGSEGYRTAEVTLGGIDTSSISSKTFEAKTVEGLYFIGEVLDVTGHLGGHNFQWAWASGFCAGSVV